MHQVIPTRLFFGVTTIYENFEELDHASKVWLILLSCAGYGVHDEYQ